MLARFNEQMETIYILLKEVDGIKLAPSVLEPEPTDINTILGIKNMNGPKAQMDGGEAWSGEATRGHGFHVSILSKIQSHWLIFLLGGRHKS
jgi:transcription initiation factor TFIIE subunit alpha